jgi:para-nitrobenzyl esterase
MKFWTMAIAATALSVALAGCWNSGSDHHHGGAIVSTSLGQLKGGEETVGGYKAQVFSDIPYAKPPVGDLRWKAPVAPDAWHGVRDATAASPICPQETSGQEDCLYMNIYRPLGAKPSSKLPVMVYAYGGANTGGSLNGVDGTRMAAIGGIIAVTFNYRIGALGFMALPALKTADGATDYGNYGILDTIAALKWVKAHIASFGGDPTKVTLASESSGSTNTCRLLVDPAAKGLFRAAVLSSEDCIHDVDDETTANGRATALATALGCTGSDADIASCMRGKSAANIATAKVPNTWNPWSASTVGHGWAVEQIEAGDYANEVPMIVGSNHHEGRATGDSFTFNATQYDQWLAKLVTDITGRNDIASIKAVYEPAVKYPNETHAVQYTIGDVITDSGMRGLGGCTNLSLAAALSQSVPTYMYQFEDDDAPPAKNADGSLNLASHGWEVKYLWTNDMSAFSAEQTALSEQMIRYWSDFAKTMNPNGGSLPNWPQLSGISSGDLNNAAGQKISLRKAAQGGSVATPTADFYNEHHCDIWLDGQPLIIDRGNASIIQ